MKDPLNESNLYVSGSMKDVKISDADFEFLSRYLAMKYGLRITKQKKILLESRLIKRLNVLNIKSVSEYLKFVFKSSKGKEEYAYFVDQITTHKTFFFRENYQFDFLKKQIEFYFHKVQKQRTVTVWSAGCSTGEEVYSLAIVLNELRALYPYLDFRILGTDISIPSLKKAATGTFNSIELENLPENLIKKYFKPVSSIKNNLFRFSNNEIINKIQLGSLNLNSNSYHVPYEYDFIFCRNVIIYFDDATRTAVLRRLLNNLKHNGFLMLGHSESAIGTNLAIESVQPTIYKKK